MADKIYIDSERVAAIGKSLNTKADKIFTEYNDNCYAALEQGKECIQLTGLDLTEMFDAFKKIYGDTKDSIQGLGNFLLNTVVKNYEETGKAVENSFNNDLTDQLSSIFGTSMGVGATVAGTTGATVAGTTGTTGNGTGTNGGSTSGTSNTTSVEQQKLDADKAAFEAEKAKFEAEKKAYEEQLAANKAANNSGASSAPATSGGSSSGSSSSTPKKTTTTKKPSSGGSGGSSSSSSKPVETPVETPVVETPVETPVIKLETTRNPGISKTVQAIINQNF